MDDTNRPEAGQALAERAGRETALEPGGTSSTALPGRPRGSVAWSGSSRGEGLARALGWFSVGLGTAQILAPKHVARLVGVRPGGASAWIMRAAGARELAHGWGILSNPTSKEWMGSRIAGDLLDLALLDGIFLFASESRRRTAAAASAVIGVTALDVLATETLAQSRSAPYEAAMKEDDAFVHRSVTVERPVQEVYAFWRDFENFPRFMRHVEAVHAMGNGRSWWLASGPAGMSVEWEAEIEEDRENELIAWRSIDGSGLYHAGVVRFREGPKGGTVVEVEMRYAPPGGTIGAALLKLFRKEPGQQVGDDLRRLKQILETGDVVLSDATLTARPRAAQPSDRFEDHPGLRHPGRPHHLLRARAFEKEAASDEEAASDVQAEAATASDAEAEAAHGAEAAGEAQAEAEHGAEAASEAQAEAEHGAEAARRAEAASEAEAEAEHGAEAASEAERRNGR